MFRARAPMGISFAGEGTDMEPYREERGGVVLVATINRYAEAALEPQDGHGIKLSSLDQEELLARGRTEEHDFREELLRTVRRRLGTNTDGFTLSLANESPLRGALTVAVLAVIWQWQNLPYTPQSLAELAYTVVHHDLGIPGGKQDQYAAAFGGFNRLEFTRESAYVIPVTPARSTLNELHASLLLCRLGPRTRRPEKKRLDRPGFHHHREPKVYAALDALKSIAYAMERALYDGRLTLFAELLHEAWLTKHKLAPGFFSERAEELYALARRKGALGGQLLGPPGEGYLLLMCPPTKKNSVAAALAAAGAECEPFAFVPHGVETWQITW